MTATAKLLFWSREENMIPAKRKLQFYPGETNEDMAFVQYIDSHTAVSKAFAIWLNQFVGQKGFPVCLY